MRKFFIYMLYIGFVMALTTSAVWATRRLSPRLQSFFVKRWCYIEVDGRPHRIASCICPCVPADRIRGGQFCKRCEHWVHSDEVYVPAPGRKKR